MYCFPSFLLKIYIQRKHQKHSKKVWIHYKSIYLTTFIWINIHILITIIHFSKIHLDQNKNIKKLLKPTCPPWVDILKIYLVEILKYIYIYIFQVGTDKKGRIAVAKNWFLGSKTKVAHSWQLCSKLLKQTQMILKKGFHNLERFTHGW